MTNPGWVDLQVNGCLGIDFSDPALTEDSILRAAEHIIASGTDVFLPTIITSPPEVYKRNPGLIKRTVETHGLHKHIPGLHFEGPFLPNGKLWNPKKNCLVGSSFLIADCMRYLEQLHLLTDDERIRVGRTNALNLIQED